MRPLPEMSKPSMSTQAPVECHAMPVPENTIFAPHFTSDKNRMRAAAVPLLPVRMPALRSDGAATWYTPGATWMVAPALAAASARAIVANGAAWVPGLASDPVVAT